MDYKELIEKSVNEKLIRIVLSKPCKADFASKVAIRPVLIREKLYYQVTKTVGSKEKNTVKEMHENMSASEAVNFLKEMIPEFFLQGLFESEGEGYSVLANRKGTVTVVKNKTVSGKKESLEHNREKKYILKEGVAVPFMVDLGVMTPDGRVTKNRYDKYRQINRYLEFVEDCIGSLHTEREITIIDFGCGKSYLTFALYYYLVELKKLNIRVIGLDLKTDVIKECNRLKNKYRYNKLEFIEGDIEHFEGVEKVDMVISLHACDTATDYALYKAIKWDADVIMAVPCCQHELNRGKGNEILAGVNEYGILKERMAAIFTDAMRANLLKQEGYETQILEFIDMEHTPKNLLIRAVKGKKSMMAQGEVKAMDNLNMLAGKGITLERLLRGID